MWGTAPEADLARARALFASGDLAGSVTASAAAASSWTDAEAVGQTRLFGVGAAVLGLLVALGLFGYWLVRRRRRPALAATTDPYATLAATPDPVTPAEPAGRFEAPEAPDAVDAGSGSGGEGPD